MPNLMEIDRTLEKIKKMLERIAVALEKLAEKQYLWLTGE